MLPYPDTARASLKGQRGLGPVQCVSMKDGAAKWCFLMQLLLSNRNEVNVIQRSVSMWVAGSAVFTLLSLWSHLLQHHPSDSGQKSWNHRKAWVGRSLKGHLFPTSLLWTRCTPTRSVCPGCCPSVHEHFCLSERTLWGPQPSPCLLLPALPSHLSKREYTLLGLYFVTNVRIESLPVVFHIPCQFQFHLSPEALLLVMLLVVLLVVVEVDKLNW